MGSESETGNLVCSFCGKRQDEVRKLIAGPTVYICDGCVVLCMQILGYEGRLPEPKPDEPKADASPEKRAHLRLRILCFFVRLLKPPEVTSLQNELVNQGRLSPEESSELSTAIETIRRLTPKISN
jgi:hypothetical protein